MSPKTEDRTAHALEQRRLMFCLLVLKEAEYDVLPSLHGLQPAASQTKLQSRVIFLIKKVVQ